MKAFHLGVFALTAALAFTQTPQKSGATITALAGSSYYQVERSNWSTYVNGKYVGLTHRETRSQISCDGPQKNGIAFSGFFYLLEETTKNLSKTAQGLNETVPARFFIGPSGRMTFAQDEGLPQMRDFPVFPDIPVNPGDRWQAEGTRSIDPKNEGKRTLLPILVEYTFVGGEIYQGIEVYRIKAKYATRINKYRKLKTDDPSLVDASGTHDADILVERDTGSVVLILDRLDDTFKYADGSTIRFRGNTAIFTDFPPAIDRASLVAGLSGIADEAGIGDRANDKRSPSGGAQADPRPTSGTSDQSPSPKSGQDGKTATTTKAETVVDAGEATIAEKIASEAPKSAFAVEETEQGVRLSVRALRFKADSDEILTEESWRLDAIADALKLVPEGHFLVEGHTAAVGKPEGEKTLSVQRAKKTVDELVRRGIPADRFIYAGYGGTRPIGDNATNEGRSQNRRVEVTILD